ncbi:MAG: UDP-N-acetylmuramate--L-alanine ligase [Planctomycetota bacterium]|jgi:UDP-N-acetylmuramate--alanine ligase
METERTKAIDARCEGDAFKDKRVHLIGVGGSGMRALGQMLLDCGGIVTGSDQAPSGAIERLQANGAEIAVGQNATNVPANCDLVVYSAAIHDQNPELLAARKRGIEVVKYSQLLGRLMQRRRGIAIAGTHGKSTTTAMVAYVLSAAGADPSFIVGASVEQLGGPSGIGKGKHFVAEACEFDRSFLNLRPSVAGILNIEEDHLDCYENLDAIVEAFRAFAALVPPDGLLVVNGEDRNIPGATRSAACEVETFALADGCTWSGTNLGTNLSTDRGLIAMDVSYGGQNFCRLSAPLPGRHSACNALASAAILHHAEIDPEQIAELLPRFTGARRRMMLKGSHRGITVLDDYAHHPTEIQATLRAIRDHWEPRRLICVFQPHQHSRTRFLLGDFARSFAAASEVIVPDIYFVRDSALEKDYISSEDLVAQIRLNGGTAIYLKTFKEIVRHLTGTLREGDLVVTMGAGDIWEVADEIVHWVGKDS